MKKNMPSVVVISRRFPNKQTPILGIWVENQVVELSKYIKILVIAPVPFIPNFNIFKNSRYYGYSKIPLWEHNKRYTVFHPRYLDIPIESFKLFRLIIYGFSILTWMLFYKVINKNIKVLHAHNVFDDAFICRLCKLFFGIPFIITIHGGDLYNNVSKRFIYSIILKNCYESKHIITVSKLLQNILLSTDVLLKNKISVIPNGIDPKKFRPIDRNAAINKLGLTSSYRYITYIGNLVKIKGIKYLLEAIPEVVKFYSDIKFLIIGSGPEKKHIQDMVLNLKITNEVYLIEQIPHLLVPFYINASNLIVLPSLNEGLPTILIEAMACGRPIVATNVGGIPELIRSNLFGLLVPAKNSKMLAESIIKAVEYKWNENDLMINIKQYYVNNIARRILLLYVRN